jgi:bifunctional DNA-binding transcriptional regulator/antitoxin component of YhaV-PrlF toxin-antitoxin module
MRRIAGSYVMKLSRNGQVSVPAEARARWETDRLLVVDLGDRVVMRPMPDDAIGALEGKYAGRGPSSERARAAERDADAEGEARRS